MSCSVVLECSAIEGGKIIGVSLFGVVVAVSRTISLVASFLCVTSVLPCSFSFFVRYSGCCSLIFVCRFIIHTAVLPFFVVSRCRAFLSFLCGGRPNAVSLYRPPPRPPSPHFFLSFFPPKAPFEEAPRIGLLLVRRPCQQQGHDTRPQQSLFQPQPGTIRSYFCKDTLRQMFFWCGKGRLSSSFEVPIYIYIYIIRSITTKEKLTRCNTIVSDMTANIARVFVLCFVKLWSVHTINTMFCSAFRTLPPLP